MKVKTESKTTSSKPTGELHLPKDFPWKVLNNLFIDLRQYLTDEDSETLTAIIRNRDVKRYLDLSKVWGLQSFAPMHDAEGFTNCKARYALASLLKKFQFSGSHDALKSAAMEKFIKAEEQCRHFNQVGWKNLMDHEEPWVHNAIYHARAFLEKLLGPDLPESSALTLWSRHGPGATCDTKNGKVSKYNKDTNFPYQCTGAALRHAKCVIRSDERWIGALEDSYRECNNIQKQMILNRKVFWSSVMQVTTHAKIHFVPKNAETYRTILIEPTLNVYLQLGVDGFMRRRLKRWGVDLDDQSKNQRLARMGSLHWDEENPYVTCDLSAASDTISRKIVELLLPYEWYSYLSDLRSPSATCEGEVFYFEKFSTMGNGFTFCLESAIFTSLIYGVMMATTGRFDREDFAVYGDDLIIRQNLYPRLSSLLSLTGFTLNADKSFSSGIVRESCGTDWARGIPIRPVFLDTVPSDVMQLFSARNRIQRMLAIRWGIEESNTVRGLDRWIPESYRNCIGPFSDECFDSFIHCASRPALRCKKGGMYEHNVLGYERERQKRCNAFHFRKLMHQLRDGTVIDRYGEDVGSGSVFTVHVRSMDRIVRRGISTAWNWRDEYTEQLPGLTNLV